MEINHKNIVLVGMPGCGKTTIAKELALRLKNFTLIDTDKEIETKENMSISDIFKEFGETYFRTLENNLINSISNSFNLIIATGGGTLENETNITNLRKNGILFFLNCSNETLYNRLKQETQRPLLQTNDLESELLKIRDKRIEKFLLADNIINAEQSIIQITEEIIQKNEQQYY